MNLIERAQQEMGIHFPDGSVLQLNGVAKNLAYAMDAQPALVTTSSSGIPAFLSTGVDPKIIEVLYSPMRAAEICGGEEKFGDWVTSTWMFPVIENTGETTAYGDHNESGTSGANVNFVQRQSFHFQTNTSWGMQELDRMGLAKIDYANRLNVASVLALNKFQNKSYFFGIAGLQNYGLLNSPALSTPISPAAKAYGGVLWSNANTTANEVLEDVRALFAKLQLQAGGMVSLDSTMTLALSPNAEVALTKTNIYNVNVADLLKKNFPNMVVKSAPEYATAGGELVQLIVTEMEGQRTATCGFTDKLRTFPVIIGSSNFKQKKSMGTWGTIIARPFLIAQLLGV